jgi:transcriptional regulator with XRE-family HTH domain
MKHKELKAAALRKKKVRKEYASLKPEFSLLRQLLAARKRARMTQSDVARRMRTKAPAITRLESSLANGGHSPSLSTLDKYARALGCHLDIRLLPSER